MSLASTSVSGSAAPADAKYRLLYFNSQGKAEVSRYLFALAHQPFIDDRIPKITTADSCTTFGSLKEDLPFEQLPCGPLPDGAALQWCRARTPFRGLHQSDASYLVEGSEAG